MSRPREFWIERKSFSSSVICAWEEKPDELTYRIAKDVIHVIEKSAYDALREQLKVAVDALEYYDRVFKEQSCVARDALDKIKGEKR